MENASKAVLIAGAILLTLTIISMAVIIVGKGKIFVNSMDKKLSQAEIENHNSQFKKYEGIVSGAEVKNACTAVAQTNDKNKVISMTIIVREKNEILFAQHPNSEGNLEDYEKIMNDIANTQMLSGSLEYNSDGIIETLIFKKK